MSCTQAIQFHTEKLNLLEHLAKMSNNAINPRERIVRYWRDSWVGDRVGSLDPTSIQESLDKYQASNPTMILKHDIQDDKLCVLLVTEFMLRVCGK